MTGLLIALAVGFAISMGAHYTGACMGMPHALGAVTARRALLIMAPLTLAGAALASHGVSQTVGFNLVDRPLSVTAQVIVVVVAFALTSMFNVMRIPTSTIQILVFAVAGVALAAGAGVTWSTIVTLAVVWVIAIPVAAFAGFALTKALDLIPAVRAQPSAMVAAPPVPAPPVPTMDSSQPGPPGVSPGSGPLTGAAAIAFALTLVGAIASFAMGANDVANAAGSLVGTGTLTPLVAGAVCGAGLSIGVLTWGRPLLRTVAFDVVTLDRPMATSAQMVQAAVVLTAVAFGLFTSMNQALIGAMAGAGLARGRHTVNRASLYGILRGWLIGPAAGFAAGLVITLVVRSAGVSLS